MQLVPVLDESQRGQLVGLLEEGFAEHKVDWRAALSAPAGRSGHGLLLLIDGRPEGGILAFEKTETIKGTKRRIVNMASWYVRPPYRKFAVRMMRALTADPDTIFTGVSATPATQAITLRVGCRYLSKGFVASAPLINGLGLGSGFTIAPFEPALSANPQQARWMADHADSRFIALSMRGGRDAAVVLWLGGLKARGLKAARLIFTDNHDLLRRALPAMHWHMLTQHGIVGLYLPRIAPYAGLRSIRKPDRGPSILVKGDVDDAEINLLYSELLYLKPAGQ